MRSERFETVIVGGGQAGLATAHHLAKEGRSVVVLDGSERIGDAWRERWDSLKLYSPAAYDALPGMPFPKPRASFPTTHEMADYLESYAARFELPVRSGVRVDAITNDGDGYVLNAGDRSYAADNVVVATGVMQKPFVPSFAPELDPRITQLHSSEYRNLTQLQPGRVLVVGASHSGADIAYETATEHETVLSGPDTGQIPASVETRRGRMGFRALFFVGSKILTADTPMGRKMRPHIRHGGAPLLRYRKKDLEAAGVERVLARVAGVQDGRPVLDDGRVLDVQNVIWCTGFRRDFSWIDVPFEMGDDGYPVQYRGVVASAPGLYFVGLLFLHSFTSMLIRGSAKDAERVARHIVETRPKAAGPVPTAAQAEESPELIWNGIVTTVRRSSRESP